MSTLLSIPFSRLVASDAINARSQTKEGLDELAASIAAKGLISPLVVRPVRPAEGGQSRKAAASSTRSRGIAGGNPREPSKYEVIDGRRRYAALAKLVKAKALDKTHEVPVIVRNEDDADALETSLAANTVRLPMHPVDQHAVFARLAEQGKSDADIAARFGIAEKTVRQHKALGRLAPAIREAWRKGKLDAKVAQAFTLAPDPAVQTALYERLAKQKDYGGGAIPGWAVRQALSAQRAPVSDCAELALVGEDAYRAAGGTISESLFEEERYVDDAPLVKKLARDRLEAECARLVGEGWSWAAPSMDGDDLDEWDCERVRARDDRRRGLDPDIGSFTAEERARSGCLVEIAGDGTLEVLAGLLRPDVDLSDDAEDEGFDDDADANDTPSPRSSRGEGHGEAVPPARGEGQRPDEDEPPDDADPYRVPQTLAYALSEALTLAAAETLAKSPALALAAAIAALTCDPWSKPVKLNANGYSGIPGGGHDEPEFADALVTAALLDQGRALDALAGLVARALDLRGGRISDGGRALVDRFDADAFADRVRDAFNAEDYFKRAPKAAALAALDEMHQAGVIAALSDDLPDAKKAAVAELATRSAKATGWLPPQLRHAGYSLLPLPEAAPARKSKRRTAA